MGSLLITAMLCDNLQFMIVLELLPKGDLRQHLITMKYVLTEWYCIEGGLKKSFHALIQRHLGSSGVMACLSCKGHCSSYVHIPT